METLTNNRSRLQPNVPLGQKASWASRVFTLETALVLSIFTKRLFSLHLAGSYVDIWQLGLALYGLIFLPNTTFLLRLWGACGLIAATSLSLHAMFGYSSSLLFKQGAAILIIYSGIGSLLTVANPGRLIKIYKTVAYWVAWIGLVQITLSFLGIQIMIKAPGQLDSIVAEPSHYGVTMAPALYLFLRNWRREKLKFAIVLISLFLTFSLTTYLLIGVVFTFALYGQRGIIGGILCALGVFYLSQYPGVIPENVQQRIDALTSFMDDDVKKAHKVQNLSVKSMATNLEVAADTLLRGRWLGNGFGGHPGAYDEKYRFTQFIYEYRYGTNKLSAHSLGIRVISEFGILGIIFIFWWLSMASRSTGKVVQIWWILSGIYFVGRVFKLGSYVDNGCAIFFLAPLLYHGARIRTVMPVRQKKKRQRRSDQPG